MSLYPAHFSYQGYRLRLRSKDYGWLQYSIGHHSYRQGEQPIEVAHPITKALFRLWVDLGADLKDWEADGGIQGRVLRSWTEEESSK